MIASALSNPEQPFDFVDLPNSIHDPLWTDIKKEHKLTLGELSALKKAACTGYFSLILFNFRLSN